jgi:membrane-bound serine protease (ClpP class)
LQKKQEAEKKAQESANRGIAESMVKAPSDIKDLIKKDDVLTLTDKSALNTKISDGTIDSQLELLKALGLQGASISRFEINWAEQFVRFLTDPSVSSFLMSGGVLGLLLEMKTPGFGFAGILSILCFALFFFGKFLVHLAGWEEVILLLAGAGLVAVEVFLLPGKILPLISGLILMVVALALAGVPKQIPFDMDFPDLHSHMNSVGLAFVVMMVGLVLIYYWISRHPIHSPLVMDETSAAVRSHIDPARPPSPGATGVAVSDLRPSGRVELDGLVFEAITQHGQYIQASEKIEVVEVAGFQVVVRQRTA